MWTKKAIFIFITASSTTISLLLLLLLRHISGPKKFIIFITSGISLTLLLLLLLRRPSSPPPSHPNNLLPLQFSFLRKVAGLPVNFPYKDLQSATDNFRTPIGRGSSSSVFRGILDDGTPVAVKRIDRLPDQADRHFRAEISIIAGLQHVNLLRLLGYCLNPSASSHRLLVYHFARHGSLDRWIFAHHHPHLPWWLRVRVAVQVAKALAYLHHHCRSTVLHLDVKPENVLLDEGFHALVADFGLSRVMGRDESRVLVKGLGGTKGYLAPEVLMETGVTEKSDVYSYGMVLLELVGGRRNCLLVEGEEGRRVWSYFPAVVVEKVRERRVMEVVDGRMGIGEREEEEVRRIVNVALWCIQEEREMRPSMERVVDMLEGRIGVVEPPMEMRMMMAEFLDVDEIRVPATQAVEEIRTPPDGLTYSFAMSLLSAR